MSNHLKNPTVARIDLNQSKYVDVYKTMLASANHLRRSGLLEESLVYLIETRASMINGCAYCIDMHTKDARANGESEQRLYGLAAWPETPYFSERERAALLWTDTVTLVSQTHIPDEVYEQVRVHFSEEELVDLTLAVIAINSWNRLVLTARPVAGSYQPAHKATAEQA